MARLWIMVDRAIFGSPHNSEDRLQHVEQKIVIWQASSTQGWDRWHHGYNMNREGMPLLKDLTSDNNSYSNNKIVSFLWNPLDLSQFPCHKVIKGFYVLTQGNSYDCIIYLVSEKPPYGICATASRMYKATKHNEPQTANIILDLLNYTTSTRQSPLWTRSPYTFPADFKAKAKLSFGVHSGVDISMVSCQKGPIYHA